MCPKSQTQIEFSSITSIIDGQDLGDLRDIWRNTATSEARLKMITVLQNKKLGFNEIQQFGLGLKYSLKSEKMQDSSEKPVQKVIHAAMEVKKRDEIQHVREMKREREERKKWLAKRHHPKTKPYKRIIQYLRQEAENAKEIQNRKYWNKIRHLEEKYRIEKDEEKIPAGMEKLSHLTVFSDERYEKIEKNEIEVPVIGEVELTAEEKMILRKNPKFALPEKLLEDTMREDMEKAYSLMRMELKDEEDTDEIRTEEEEEKEQKMREEEAKTRQIFCPIEQKYDERNRRVTDLVECNRVTLPKPIRIEREAQIETRRTLHERIYQEYRRENTKENGEQKSNLTEEEEKGLRSLQKRMKNEDLVIMKTDKSGKMSVTKKENYLEMGKAHTGEDKKVGREKIREIDKLMSEHSVAWCSMWKTGKNHEQEDRVINSKTSKSENRAKLYLTHKDHKKENGKTRPIGTANSSNTRGFANCISDLLEAVANCEKKSNKVISSEDLLHSAKGHNREMEKIREELEEKKKAKNECWECKRWKRKCVNHGRKEKNEIVGENIEEEETSHRVIEEIIEQTIEMTVWRKQWREENECAECDEVLKKSQREDCVFCGPGIDPEMPRMSLVGMDAVALFPSLSGRKTSEIVGRRVAASPMKMDGFSWRRGMVYVKTNRRLVREIPKELKKYLPLRKSSNGVEPGMASKSLRSDRNLEKQWYFMRENPTEQEVKMMIGLVAEIGIRILWDNYCYDFG